MVALLENVTKILSGSLVGFFDRAGVFIRFWEASMPNWCAFIE